MLAVTINSEFSLPRLISNQWRVLESYVRTSKFPRPRPLISAVGGWGSKVPYVYCIDSLRKSENPCGRWR